MCFCGQHFYRYVILVDWWGKICDVILAANKISEPLPYIIMP